MILIKLSLPLCLLVLVHGDVAPGQNQYLPPQKGYKYDKPSVTFSTPTTPRPRPRPPGTTPYRPPQTTPYRPPQTTPYRPPQTTPYRPPTPSYTPPRPTATRPTYIPPPTPTRPPYVPSPTPTRPTYVPPPTPTRPRPTPTGPNYIGEAGGHHHEHVGGEHDHHHHHEPGMPFDFTYAVNDIEHGNDYSHNAVSDGDITRGEYRIKLPDGRLQIVKYTADWKNGFNAQVSFEGSPSYPNYQGSGSSPQGQGGYKY